MRRSFTIAALTLFAAVRFPAAVLHAADGVIDPSSGYTGPPNLYAAYEPDPDPSYLFLPNTVPVEQRRFAPLARSIHNCPWYCVSHHNSVGCGSLKADCVFIFGGCHLFYGEPCFKGPSPYAHHHGAGKGDATGNGGCASCAGP